MMAHWTSKYHGQTDFLKLFKTEQDFIDATFMLIIMVNYGVYVAPENLHKNNELTASP